MKRRRFPLVSTLLFWMVLLDPAMNATAAEVHPNILIIYADDMGYADLGCYGAPIKTPRLDQLAKQGLRFTDFYAGAPNCSPSRACLLTGRIPARTGIYNYIPPESAIHLPPDEITLARLLKDAGYATGLFGKWHLSEPADSPQPPPAAYGFDYTFCTRNNAEPSHQDPVNFYRNGVALGPLDGYSCDLVAAETKAWLQQRKSDQGPFLAYVAFHEPHQKIAAPPELVQGYKDAGHEYPLYAATIANLDQAIGKILDTLDTLGLTENTLVFFASDNGPWRDGSQGPLRGKKSDIWDGGIRVPGIVRWPGHVTPGSTSGTPAGVVDLLPTLCAIAGIDTPADRTLDGTDLTPIFAGVPLIRDTPLFWYFYRNDPQMALRDGDWTLVGHIDDPVAKRTHWLAAEDMPFVKSSVPNRFELFHIREDVAQQRDRAGDEPERLATMKAAMLKLHREVVTEGDDWTEAIQGYTRPAPGE